MRGDPAPERHQVVGVPRLEGRVLEHPVFVTCKTQVQTRNDDLTPEVGARLFPVRPQWLFVKSVKWQQQVQLAHGRGVVSQSG